MFSVIVSTYNAPRELDLTLCGISRQTCLPNEVLIADDGSTRETHELVASWIEKLGCELRHVWQCDRGYRKARIVNEAVRRAHGDHLVFLDGDSVPHSSWMADHVQAADDRRVLCGRRVKLGPDISHVIDRALILGGGLESMVGQVFKSVLKGETRRYMLGIRLPAWLARTFHPRPRKLMGVNFSLPREAFERVNGYDEEWIDYEREDRDLELRLLRSDIPFYPLLNRAVVYHLYHPMRPVSKETEAKVRAEENSHRTRCEKGLFQENPFDPHE